MKTVAYNNVDLWLSRASKSFQIAMALTIIFTVIPVYENKVLSEEKAELQDGIKELKVEKEQLKKDKSELINIIKNQRKITQHVILSSYIDKLTMNSFLNITVQTMQIVVLKNGKTNTYSVINNTLTTAQDIHHDPYNNPDYILENNVIKAALHKLEQEKIQLRQSGFSAEHNLLYNSNETENYNYKEKTIVKMFYDVSTFYTELRNNIQ
ncbi:hypothetical protein [Maridesulfovibrio sp.]|uniref:hypothetical protein n=1 Tax=Maridesulfovibrio sp. TaxID=2795000 RepID=UPI0029F464C6|nr:hypothetical protein [Maridesulfovibrio sp.]